MNRPIFEGSAESSGDEINDDIATGVDSSNGFTGSVIKTPEEPEENNIKVKLISNQKPGGRRGTI